VILPSHYGFFVVVTRFATSQFEQELFNISSHHYVLKTKFSQHQFHQELSNISSRQFAFKIS